MTYEIILNSLRSSYNWLFSVYFPRIFAFIKNNQLVSAALIISFVVPALFLIINFILNASSDTEFFTIKVIRNKKNGKGSANLNKYQKAYLNSLRFNR